MTIFGQLAPQLAGLPNSPTSLQLHIHTQTHNCQGGAQMVVPLPSPPCCCCCDRGHASVPPDQVVPPGPAGVPRGVAPAHTPATKDQTKIW